MPRVGGNISSNVKLATVKVDGLYKDMRVAVKTIKRQTLPREDEENLLEEVGVYLP